MIKSVQESIRKHQLLHNGDRVLVAVSGGADSVALLCLLHHFSGSLGLKLAVAHINHHIRGRESDIDAEFVKKLSSRFGIPFAGGNVDVPRMARNSGLSIEMAARKARYSFLLKTARKFRSTVIATAHTADDQAETVLLKLARGAGSRGLAGIPREIIIDGIRIVRPLLDARRGEIETFLKEKGQKWREDKSNTDISYLRNRVRHEILPFLEKKLNPEIRLALLRASEVLREEDNWLEKLTAEIFQKCLVDSRRVLNIRFLNRQCVAARRRVLRQWLSSAGVLPELLDYDVVMRVDALLQEKKGSGKTEVAEKWIVKRRYDHLIVEKNQADLPKTFRLKVRIPGTTRVACRKWLIKTSLEPRLVKDRIIKPGHLPAKASLDFSKFGKRKLIVRSWQKGDRIRPFGMTGSKKLQDIFIDEKVPAEQRSNVPVFECGNEIVWIAGYRVARGWEVKLLSKPVLQICIEKTGSNSGV